MKITKQIYCVKSHLCKHGESCKQALSPDKYEELKAQYEVAMVYLETPACMELKRD